MHARCYVCFLFVFPDPLVVPIVRVVHWAMTLGQCTLAPLVKLLGASCDVSSSGASGVILLFVWVPHVHVLRVRAPVAFVLPRSSPCGEFQSWAFAQATQGHRRTTLLNTSRRSALFVLVVV